MKLTDMKLSRKKNPGKENPETEATPSSGDDRDYPYGLSLILDKDSLKKLGMEELPEVGETCMIHAAGEITRVSQSVSDSGENKSVEIQITKLSVMPGMGDDMEEEELKKGYAKGRGPKLGW